MEGIKIDLMCRCNNNCVHWVENRMKVGELGD